MSDAKITLFFMIAKYFLDFIEKISKSTIVEMKITRQRAGLWYA